MDYFKHYELLIERARNRIIEGYKEKHHIWPRCIGGVDEKFNIVELTAEEHYVAHQLLVKMFPKEKGLVWSAHQMAYHSNTDGRVNNKLYSWLKRRNQTIAKQRIGEKNGSYGRSWYYNPETLDNIKCLPDEVPEGYIKGRKFKDKELTSKDKEFTICIVCGTMTNSKKAKYCDSCRPKQGKNLIKLNKESASHKSLFEYEEEFIEEYRKTNSMNRSLKNLGYPGAVGNWYKEAKEILEKHNLK